MWRCKMCITSHGPAVRQLQIPTESFAVRTGVGDATLHLGRGSQQPYSCWYDSDPLRTESKRAILTQQEVLLLLLS